METSIYDPRDKGHLPRLGKLGLSLLEHINEILLGKKVVEELRAPHDRQSLRESLDHALVRAEERFATEYSDKEIGQALLNLPLAPLPSTQNALNDFYAFPAGPRLEQGLRSTLHRDLPNVEPTRIHAAASAYVGILRQELVVASDRLREVLTSLAALDTVSLLEQLAGTLTPKKEPQPILGNLPRRPSLVIGREDALTDLKTRLMVSPAPAKVPLLQVLTTLHGWPGVGKTTLASLLPYDAEVQAAFPDGILWTSLGQKPDVFSELATWGRALGSDDIRNARTIQEASTLLTRGLRDKRMLLIVDDVWQPEHAIPFQVGGSGCATLITTRLPGVAGAIASIPENVYVLNELSQDKAFELLQALAPTVVAEFPLESKQLVHELAGLPLAIQVAGRLLNVEARRGFNISSLLIDLREGTKILSAPAPADQADIVKEATPTVVALLSKSTEMLDTETRDRFAFLAPFASKPSTFDLEALKAVWDVSDPQPTVMILVDRGLLEPAGSGRFQIHALLVKHARYLLGET